MRDFTRRAASPRALVYCSTAYSPPSHIIPAAEARSIAGQSAPQNSQLKLIWPLWLCLYYLSQPASAGAVSSALFLGGGTSHGNHGQKTVLAPPATAKSIWHPTGEVHPGVLEVSLSPWAWEGGVEGFVRAERRSIMSVVGLCAVVPPMYPEVVLGRLWWSCCSVVGG